MLTAARARGIGLDLRESSQERRPLGERSIGKAGADGVDGRAGADGFNGNNGTCLGFNWVLAGDGQDGRK
jgi:hypothetical protein